MENENRLDVNKETQKKIERIREAYQQSDLTQKQKAEATRLVDEVLEEMFKTPYSFMIPMEFLNSSVGSMLMSVKYSYEYYYGTFDLQIICGKARSTIYYSNDRGKYELLNKGGVYVATESEVRKLMASYGWSDKVINNRLNAFWKVKSNLNGKRILKKDFEAEFKKILKNKKSV